MINWTRIAGGIALGMIVGWGISMGNPTWSQSVIAVFGGLFGFFGALYFEE